MTTFADLGLSPSTVQAVADTGYTVPTPIQEQAVPVALAGRDVLGIAQTGTGKTAAFTLPMIDRLSAGRAKARMPRSLVVCPTRELADQVAGSFEKYAKGTRLSWALLIGGVSFKDQETKIDRGVDVLIATPGRLLDFYERRKIMLLDVKTLVVDEADRMLDMGFIPDLEKIFEITPKGKQTLFFSATMPPEITRLTAAFLNDPTRIEVSRPATTNENITQFVVHLPTGEPKAKRMALRALIERAAPESGIVFCNRKSEVDIVAKSLQKYGLDAAPIHGDLDQSQRTKTLEMFRKGELKLLVASDVAARGLDIPQVSDIFNFDVPHHADDYVHRIGRTGRAGRKGEAFMIVTPNDERGYDKVVKLIKIEPETITLELDWAEAEAAGKRDRERHGGRREREGRGRGAGGGGRERDRDRGRDRPVADHGQRASMDAISTPEPGEPAPVEERSPRPAQETAAEAPRRERGDRPRRDREARPEREARGDREARGERPRREDREPRPDGDEVVSQPAEREPPVAPRAERDAPPRRAEREDSSSRRGERDRDRGPRRDRGGERDWRWDRDDRPVVGFGSEGDTPAFLLRSAASAIAALQNVSDEPDEVAPVRSARPEVELIESASEVEDVETAAPAERTRSRRRRRGGHEREAVEATPDAEEGIELAEAAETAAAEAAVSAEPAPASASAEDAAEAPAPKRRTRRKAPESASADSNDAGAPSAGAAPDAAPAAPPARARRSRKPAAAASDVEAQPAAAADSAEAPEAAAPARKRSRRKADAVAETAAEALPGDVIPG